MLRQTYFFVFIAFLLTPLSMKAQKTPICGLSAQDARIVFNNMQELRERHPYVTTLRAVAYVPVWFHLVAKTDGTGRISMVKVLEMLCEWNRLYAANGVELQFYIKGINNINNSTLYDDVRTFNGETALKAQKKADGINVFIVNNANEAGQTNSTVLGYYQNTTTGVPYDADWLVIIKQQTSAAGAVTIVHEIGHFFGLSHTFLGWEACPFEPTSAVPCAPATINCFDGTIYPVENAARTGTSANCATAGDGFCDTPPDYNLGFGASTCSYIGLACDPKGIKIDPDEKNMMGYFVGCETSFSTMQKTAMQNNYLNHAKRANLRTGNVTPQATAFTIASATLVAPINGATTSKFNNFNLSWQAVTNATAYVVEISKSPTLFDSRTFVATTNALNVNSSMAPAYFVANTTYYWRVKPYNSFAACGPLSSVQSLKTGLVNATNDISSVSNFEVTPTPLSKNQVLTLHLTTETAFDAQVKIFNSAGQLVQTEKRAFDAGFSTQTLSVAGLQSGLYILSVASEKGVLNRKIIVQ